MTSPVLEIRDLVVQLNTERGVVKALNGIDLTLESGEIHGLIGESGCGKSLTARSILRLLPKTAEVTRGEILFEGINLLQVPPREMRQIRGKNITLIMQEPSTALNPVLRIGSQITEAIKQHNKGISSQRANKLMLDVLTEVEMPSPERNAQAYPHELSGGMQQRAMIAMALSCKPSLLIADEPTTALDVTVQAQILDLLRHLARSLSLSILFITHDFGVVADICDNVSVMYAGRVIESTDVNSLFERPTHPYSQGLLRAMPQNRAGRKAQLGSIPGTVPDLINVETTGCMFRDRCPSFLEVCGETTPQLLPIERGHFVACHFYHQENAGSGVIKAKNHWSSHTEE